jgi:hypothetical protein
MGTVGKILLALWLALTTASGFQGRYRERRTFGPSVSLLSACVAGFWWTSPSPWMHAWLVAIVAGLNPAALEQAPRSECAVIACADDRRKPKQAVERRQVFRRHRLKR